MHFFVKDIATRFEGQVDLLALNMEKYRVIPNIHRSEVGCLSPSVAGAPWTIPW